ncbi:MAG: hypothetical protein E7564_10855 [Ruminococcaceae bacterium]|nr:hypothetical protein [Oscillospiraceae bacterium]
MNKKLTDKGKIFVLSLFISLLVGTLIIISFEAMFKKGESEKEIPISDTHYTKNIMLSQENSEIAESNSPNLLPSPLFTVKEYKGVIGIYNFGESTPFETENLFVNNLPEKDREILKNGRDFYSYREMVEFLKDYE